MAQALVRFLTQQRTSRDGREQPLFGGVFGIFGHGNVAGIGQALQEERRAIRYYLARNEQAMVHTAAAYAKMHNRLRTLACTTSIGPGASFDYPAYKEAERPEDLASARAIKLFTESCGIACNQTKLLRSINVFA